MSELANIDLSDPYHMLKFSIRSESTRKYYERRIKRFLDYIESSPNKSIEERFNEFAAYASKDMNWTLNKIIAFLQFQKERTERGEITAATLSNFVKPLKLYCEISDLKIPWKKIVRGLPRGREAANDRAPTVEEIQRLVEYPDRRIRPIVYTMASSGIRLGAFDLLQWKHIIPIYDNDGKVLAAKIIVYAGDNEEYYSFLTAEAYDSLKKWMEFRESYGEKISGDSWVFRDLVVSQNGVVYVSDGTNHRVQVFVPKNSTAVNNLKNLQDTRTEDEEVKQAKFYLAKIGGESKDAAEAAWKGLEILARYRQVWLEDEVWNAITNQIFKSSPDRFSREALDLLKTMLFTAKEYPKSKNNVQLKARELYLNKLIEILESKDKTWQHEKPFAKLILDEILNDNERYDVYWRAWKSLAINLENDSGFLKFASYFIRDLELSSIEFKKKIEPEIFILIESTKLMVSKRAKDFHSLLFD